MKIHISQAEQAYKHILNLSNILFECGVKGNYGDTLSFFEMIDIYKELNRIENRLHYINEKECNGISTEADERTTETLQNRVKEIFNNNLKGLYFNGDPRGYTLKIKEPKEYYTHIPIYQDFGGYGIICPDFTYDLYKR